MVTGKVKGHIPTELGRLTYLSEYHQRALRGLPIELFVPWIQYLLTF